MSTRCSLAWGDKFHVYTDHVEDHAFVHVEIAGADFAASPGQVTVRIPVSLWEHIRAYSPARYDLANLTDAKLRQLARKRAAENEKMLHVTPRNSPYRALLSFRLPATEREIHRQLKADRKAQQKLQSEVQQLRSQRETKIKKQNQTKRHKRVLLPEYQRLMARRPREGQIQQALDEARGGD